MHKKSGATRPTGKRHRSLRAVLLATCIVGFGAEAVANQPVRHPLDPFTTREYAAISTALERGNYVDANSRYALITLDEPPKAEVLHWKPGVAIQRRAFVIVKNGRHVFEAVVDVSKLKVLSWEQVKDGQPGILNEEWTSAQEIVRANPEWQAAVRRRGVTDFEGVVCIPLTAGSNDIAQEMGQRLVKVVCFDGRGIRNFWGRPIEGLIAVVDLHQRAVVRLIDPPAVPIPKAAVDFDEDSVGKLREPPNPVSHVQSRGPSFRVAGHEVGWQKWRFHFRIDPRVGPVVSTVRYNDGGKMRSILYQGCLSELFVPYMDPGEGWYFRTYMDAGQYGVGRLAAPLQPGLDCPPNAVFFDAVFADDRGKPYTQQRLACLFERYSGDIAWRHYEAVNGNSEVRRRTELVLRFISAVGNYDYIFDWVFCQDGTIKVAVGASGIEQVKAVQSRTLANDTNGRDTAYGHMVAEHTVAINHDHFFCFRLDLDVDGPTNSFVVDHLRTKRLAEESPRKSIWAVESRTPATEQAAKLRINLQKPALWRVLNSNVVGPLGYPVSYQLKPKSNVVPLLSPDDPLQQRAGFTDFHLWVTPYDPSQRYAAGIYPNQSKGGGGLPAWTKANRPIQKTDVVLWYTLGFHHVVRAEDWPVLPTGWHGFELRPFDFFRRNPALDLPE